MSRLRPLRGPAALAGVAALLLTSGCSGTDSPEPGATSPSATSPSATATAAPVAPGTLLTHDDLADAAALSGTAGDWRVTYQSENGAGRPIVVSGMVSVPAGDAPEDGWPVVSWGHGTTGYADVCAPSAQGTEGLASQGYLNVMNRYVQHWIDRGFAVARTDYEGLGTPGGHPYMGSVSAANTVTDIVRAARQLDSSVGSEWVAVGHSQGGAAALSVAQLGPERAPELTLRGAVSIAPGGVGIGQTPAWAASAPKGAEAIQPYIPLIVLGAQAGDPTVDAASIFSKDAGPLLDYTRSGCPWGPVPAPEPIPSDTLFAQDADLGALEDYLNAQDPLTLTPAAPVLLQAGRADTEVAVAGVQGLQQTYCAAGSAVTYRDYEGLDHVPMLVDPAPLDDATAWVDAVMAGEPDSDDCA